MSVTTGDASATSGTQSIQRAALLLRLLTAHHRTGLRLVELYRQAELERPTAHRILQGLIAERLVMQDQVSKRYYLGPLVYEMGLAASARSQLRDICHGHLRELAEASTDTVFLTARSGLDGVCLDRAEGAFPIKVFVLEVGRRRPLGAGGGAMAILSAMAAAESERILQSNAARLRDRFPRYDEDTARSVIVRGRGLGHVIYDVLEVPGIRTVAMPIVDSAGQSVAALSIATMAQRLQPDRVAELLPTMRGAGVAIREELAAQPPVDVG